ncbi:autophagy-related protein 2 B-like protein, partial [Camelus ferus]
MPYGNAHGVLSAIRTGGDGPAGGDDCTGDPAVAEKLSLEQLSLDLYQGTGSLAQVPLDKWCLNEILESADAPLEVTEGFIQSISLSVPWGSLLQDNCALEVKGLEMVFRPRPRLVLRRVKVTFIDTVLRIEHVPENSKTGTALEIRIERTVYCDEAADEPSGISVHQPTAFAHKLLRLSGVSLFWDEFSASAKSSPVCSAAPVIRNKTKLQASFNLRSDPLIGC